MEALGYLHSQAAYEAAVGLEYDLTALRFNWRMVPNSAWLGLLAAGVLCAALSAQKPAFALYVNTPSGTCLNARYGPGTQYGVFTCVTNGAALASPSGRTSGNWLELETGRWVYAPFTGDRPTPPDVGGRLPVQVNTPSGACLNARYGPSVESGVYMCVTNGSVLKPVIGTDATGNWLQLSSGRWVYGPYTSPIGTGGRPPGPAADGFPLRRGMRGEAVGALQGKLNDLGYPVGASGVDRIFGPSTEAAVRRFQAARNLTVDGIVGPATSQAMGLILPGDGA